MPDAKYVWEAAVKERPGPHRLPKQGLHGLYDLYNVVGEIRPCNIDAGGEGDVAPEGFREKLSLGRLL